jgi:SAM-dependent methyltransferase
MTDQFASRTVDRCRVCQSERLHRYLDMGRTPLANSYLSKDRLKEPEFSEELCLQVCLDCGLSQLTKVVHPDLMFRHYLYVSATTATIRDHFAEFAATTARAAGAKPGDIALDIASNDGTLLAAFKAVGLKPIGVDPAENLAAEANAKGLTTWCDYWSVPVAEKLVKEVGRPKVITAANVFAHADGLVEFVRGVAACLAPGGLFAIECPYAVDFIQKSEFDTAYHEHVSYVGLTPLSVLMKAHGLELYDVEYFPDIHGGTIRSYTARAGERKPTAKLKEMLANEEKFGIRDAKVYDAFAKRVLENREKLRALIAKLNSEGKTVWAYGASAKGNTLMNFFGLDSKAVPRAIDDNPKKWGYYSPGARMEIVGIDALKTAKVDCLLLLAWNFEKEIRRRCQAAGYKGRFLVPVPEARLVSAE